MVGKHNLLMNRIEAMVGITYPINDAIISKTIIIDDKIDPIVSEIYT
jgi:hypothetical protein